MLKGPRDFPLGSTVRRLSRDICIFEDNPPFAGAIGTSDTVQQTGLAGPVRADDRQQLALLRSKRNIVQRNDATEAQRDLVNLKK